VNHFAPLIIWLREIICATLAGNTKSTFGTPSAVALQAMAEHAGPSIGEKRSGFPDIGKDDSDITKESMK
jgi:hypothetical protein